MKQSVFISYSHKDEKEKDKLLSHLGVLQKANLITVWSDDRIAPGANWKQEIEQAMIEATVAILFVTSEFLNSDFILREEVPRLLNRRKNKGLIILPIIAKPCAWEACDWLKEIQVRPKNAKPVWSDGGIHVDEDLAVIAKELTKILKRPSTKITSSSSVVKKEESTLTKTFDSSMASSELIKITGVIENEVTFPKNDGTRGSALYAIPFQLSRRPSYEWCQMFIEAWNRPSRFSTMHRPGIASVVGDRVILDGTTMKEVEMHHLETLKLAIEAANQKLIEFEENKRIQKNKKGIETQNHKSSVKDISNRLKFD